MHCSSNLIYNASCSWRGILFRDPEIAGTASAIFHKSIDEREAIDGSEHFIDPFLLRNSRNDS